MNSLLCRPLNSQVHKVISEDFKCVPSHYPDHNSYIYITHVFSQRFRHLVVGKVRPASLRRALTRIDLGFHQGGSGKSSLIKTVFKVDVTVRSHTSVILRCRRDRTMKTTELKDTQGKSDINVGFRPEDNRHLVVHEFSAFGSQTGDSKILRTMWDFISYRTDPSCPASERLHAIW